MDYNEYREFGKLINKVLLKALLLLIGIVIIILEFDTFKDAWQNVLSDARL